MVKTWYYEAAVMALLLGISLMFGVVNLAALLSAAAVFTSFMHCQVSDRLREYASGQQAVPPECHTKERYYFFLKEILWIATFISLQAWPALIGSFGFIIYPIWRKFWRQRKSNGQ